MPAIIVYSTHDGVVHTCSASCYNSQQHECTCICRGRNHRLGLDRALKMNRQWIKNHPRFQLPNGEIPESIYVATRNPLRTDILQFDPKNALPPSAPKAN